MPSEEQIHQEFEERMKTLTQAQGGDSRTPEENIFEVASAAHKGEDDEVDLTKLEQKLYVNGPGHTKFFSSTSLQDLFAILVEFGTKKGEVKFSKSTYKVTITHVGEGERTLKMVGEITKVNESKHCLEFRKKQGLQKDFHDLYKQVKCYFGGHANEAVSYTHLTLPTILLV